MTKKTNIVQMDFTEALFKQPTPVADSAKPAPKNERKVLPRKQMAGFREDYNEASMIMYIVGILFDSEKSREDMPEEIRRAFEKAKKTKERYERYKPKAAQTIVNYGRDVADAYTTDNHEFLRALENEADHSKYPQKRRMYTFTKRVIDRMIDIIRLHNEII